MTFIGALIVLALLGWLLEYAPGDSTIKAIIRGLLIFAAIILVLQAFGVPLGFPPLLHR